MNPDSPYLVKVRYISENKKKASDREYVYCSAELLEVGDIVLVPVRDTLGKAEVTEVDVPESEISAFRDKVKTIPEGSVFSRSRRLFHVS